MMVLEKVTPALNMAILRIYVQFRGCIHPKMNQNLLTFWESLEGFDDI